MADKRGSPMNGKGRSLAMLLAILKNLRATFFLDVQLWGSKSISGWWYTYRSENYEIVSWDDYSQYMGK